MFICGKKNSMSASRLTLLNKIGIVSLFLMVYSGYIKWMPILIVDPFILFAIFIFLSIITHLFRNNFNSNTIVITSILILFFSFCFISTIWGLSKLYYLEKLQKVLVLIFCFVTPFYLLRFKKNIYFLFDIYHIFCILVYISILTIFLIFGNIYILIDQDPSTVIKNMPDYLALGTLLSCSFILALNKKNSFFWISHKIIIFSTIVILAPRGPILSLVIILILYSLVKYNITSLFKKIFFITITSLFINIILIGFTDRLISRLTNIFDTESTSYTSLDSRFDLTTYAWNYFLKYPITGIGFGSFGINYSGTEDRIEPHNIILEIMSQTGIIGLFLFLLFLFTIFIFIYKKYNRDDNINLILILIIVFLFLQTLISTYLIDSKDLFFWLGVILCYNSINNRYEYKK